MMLKLPRMTIDGQAYYLIKRSDVKLYDFTDFEKDNSVEIVFDGTNYLAVPIVTSLESMNDVDKSQEVNKLLKQIEEETKKRKAAEKKLEQERASSNSRSSSSYDYGCGSSRCSSSGPGCGSSSDYDPCGRSHRSYGGC